MTNKQLIALLTLLSFSLHAGIEVVYGTQNGDQLTYDTTDSSITDNFVVFPGYGSIRSDKTCIDYTRGVLKAVIPARSYYTCANGNIDYAGSLCVSKTWYEAHELKITAPFTYTATECLQEKVDYSDSMKIKQNTECMYEDKVEKDQNLSYLKKVYEADDYKKEQPAYEEVNIPECE